MDSLGDFMLLVVCIVSTTLSSARDLESTALGVKFTHKGYFTTTSSHYIHTVRVPSIAAFPGETTPFYFNFDYLYCDHEHAIMRYIPEDLFEAFCQQTHNWRVQLEKHAYGLRGEISDKQKQLNQLFPDKIQEIEEQARRSPRFAAVLTGAASLVSWILDTYEKIVVAKQICHLSRNQEILFSNQNRMMKHLQSTQRLNDLKIRNLTRTMIEYRAVMRRLWQQMIWGEEQLNRLGKNVRLLHAFHRYSRYVNSVHLPSLEYIPRLMDARMNAIQAMVQGKIPETLIDPKTLGEILENAQGQLADHNAQLAVTDLELLYNMRVTTTQ